MRADYDAIIIGGGPAGALLAHALALAGRRIMLIERRKPGTGKACGHCLNARVLPLLQRAGLGAAVQSVAIASTRRLIVHSGPGRPVYIPLAGGDDNDSAAGLVTPRERLDDLLLSAAARAGADIMRPATARIWSVDRSRAAVEILSTQRSRTPPLRASCSVVIAADGLRSSVARAFAATPAESFLRGRSAMGISFDFDLPRDLSESWSENMPEGTIAMHISRGGYVGVVRSGPRVHLGALLRGFGSPGARPAALSRLAPMLERTTPILARAVARAIESRSALRNLHAVGPMPWRPRRVAGPQWALVGDAAGYAEPFTGEGISWAIEGADTLARIIIDAGDPVWNSSAAIDYERAWRRTIGTGLRECDTIGAALRSRAAVVCAAAFLRALPATGALICDRICTPRLGLSA